MKLFAKLTAQLSLSAVILLGASAFAGSYVETSTGTDFQTKKSWATDIYANTSIKINDRYTFTPETLNTVQYVTYSAAGAKSTMQLTHKYLRFTVSDKRFANLGSWTLSSAYRWVAPTDNASEKAGSIGIFMYRPAISNKWGSLSLMIRNSFLVPLNRKPYQVNVPVATATGNVVFIDSLEFLPEFDFGGGFSMSAVWNPFYYRYGATYLGAKKAYNRGRFYHEYELDYQSEAIDNFKIGLNLSHDNRFGATGDGKIKFFSNETSLALVVARNF